MHGGDILAAAGAVMTVAPATMHTSDCTTGGETARLQGQGNLAQLELVETRP
jgi:hypothetical protein